VYIKKVRVIFRRRFWFHQWRVCHREKFNIGRFNVKEATYAFLREYDEEPFIKAQKVNKYLFFLLKKKEFL
jgi:hypothetical protein